MPVRFLIDVEASLVCSHGVGVFGYQEAVDHDARLSADGRFHDELNQVADFRDTAEVRLAANELQALARQSIFAASAHRAFVVSALLDFGLARMYATLQETHGAPNVRVVRTLEDAANWVKVDLPRVQAAFAALKSGEPIT